MTPGLPAAVVVTLVVVAGLALALPGVLRRTGLVDTPTGRSSHAVPTPRGGGVALVVGLLAGAATGTVAGTVLAGSAGPAGGAWEWAWVWGLLAAVGAAALLGLAEDARGLAPRTRLLGQLLVGGVAGAGIAVADGSGWVWVPVAAVAFAAYVNAANFMDGVDTISAWHLVAVGASYAAAGALDAGGPGDRTAWLVPAGLLLAAAGLGFLPANGVVGGRAQLFLGDVGSYAVGAAVAFCAGAGFLTGLSLEVALAPLVVWLADTGHTLLRRLVDGEQLSVPHRRHAYQRLVDSGLSHRRVGALAGLATALCGAIALVAVDQPLAVRMLAVAGLVVVAVGWLALPAARGVPYPRAGAQDARP